MGPSNQMKMKVHGLVRPSAYLVLCGRSPAYVTTANWKDVTCKDCLRKIDGQVREKMGCAPTG
jgi:hypothetical protein